MKKLSSTPIKISALTLFIIAFALPIHHAPAQELNAQELNAQELNAQELNAQELNAQENDDTTQPYDYHYHADATRYIEIYTSFGNAYNADPETWNNDNYYAIGFRFANQDKDYRFADATYFGFELAETSKAISPIDGLTRQSAYLKLGGGWIYNNTAAPTSSFVELGLGFITTAHFVQGEAAWKSPESEEIYHHQVAYENRGIAISDDTGVYLHFGLGVKIKNRHKLSLYISPVYEGRLSARSIVDNNEDGSQPESYYYGEIPDRILYGMAGFRYSYIFQSSWEKTSHDIYRSKIYPHQ